MTLPREFHTAGGERVTPRAPARAGIGVATTAILLAPVVVFALVMSVLVGPGPGRGDAGHAGHAGPVASDYVPISAAPTPATAPRPGPAASTGSFGVLCGRNAEGHRNSDNFITAPGRSNGAHHVHDYVGNVTTDGGSTDESLAAAATTCVRGDKSAYFWPVLRDVRHAGPDAEQPGGGRDGNLGQILTPAAVSVEFLGNAQAPVRSMPMFLRIVTGDAKAVTRGPGAARARWSCSGTPGRASGTQYPLCPAGQLVQRVGEFPSCWNGADLDSDTHRTHVTFADPGTGACPTGTIPIPRLVVTVSYRVPPGRSFAVDSFPDQGRKPATDHFDFENVMPQALMTLAVRCINTGRAC
ncbi:MAG TPA: DUF1996 domain-containing protein [Mycobacteriales bacterium]